MNRRSMLLVLLALMVQAAGCGDDVAAFSGPVSINLDKFKDGDVQNNSFDSDKNVNTEPGNPYGAFLSEARRNLGNRDPAAIVIDRMDMTIAAGTSGVTTFEQFMSGTVTVYVATSAATVNVASVPMATGAGPVSLTISATRDTLAPVNAALLNGSFKIGIRVNANTMRPAHFDAKVSLVTYFRALAS